MWERIIKALRAKGYKGEEKPESIKAWLKEQNSEAEFVDGDGNSVTIEDAFKTKAAKVKKETILLDDAGDTDDSQVTPDGEDAEVAKFRDWQRKQRDAAKGTKAGRLSDTPGVISEKTKLIDRSKDRYNARVEMHRKGIITGGLAPVWSSADEAEEFAAPIRLWLCKSKGDFDYPMKDHDKIVAKTWQTNINTGAGYMVQPQLVSTVMWLTEQYGVSLKLANVVTMTSDERRQPRQTSIPAMAALSEGGTYAESDAALDMITMRAKKAGRIYAYSWEIFEDAATSVSDLIARNAAEAAALRIDTDYIDGDGTSTYNGIVGLENALPSGAYINGSGASWSALAAADFWKLSGSVENVSQGRLAFLGSRQFFHQVVLKLSQATAKGQQRVDGVDSIMASAMMGQQQGGGIGGYLNGFPFYFDQSGSCPIATAATSKVCYFGDFSGGSMIGLRNQLELETSTEAGWTTDTIKIKARMRYDVNIHGDGRGSTFGPIVALVTT